MVLRRNQLGKVKTQMLGHEKLLDKAFTSRISRPGFYLFSLFMLLVGIGMYLSSNSFNIVFHRPVYITIYSIALLSLFAGEIVTNDLMVITNIRIMLVKGILHTSMVDVVFRNITDTMLYQSFTGKMFGYADLLINTAGSTQSEVVMRGILYPEKRKKLIDSLIHMGHQQSQQQRRGVQQQRSHGYQPQYRRQQGHTRNVRPQRRK